MSILVYLELTG